MTDDDSIPRYRYIFFGLSPYIALAFLNGIYNPPLHAANVTAFWIVDVLHYWILPLSILYLFFKRLDLAPRDYGLAGSSPHYPAWEMFGAGVFAAVILFITDQVAWHLAGFAFGFDDYSFSFNEVVPQGKWHIPVVLYLAFTAGFIEEVIFRGLFWAAISEIAFAKYGKLIYVVASSFVFAVIHWEQGLAGVLASFAFGLVAAIFYLQLRNLWPMITAHTLVDIYYFW